MTDKNREGIYSVMIENIFEEIQIFHEYTLPVTYKSFFFFFQNRDAYGENYDDAFQAYGKHNAPPVSAEPEEMW